MEESETALGEKSFAPVFDPPINELVPMLSVLGSPPIPVSTNPVDMLEKVSKHVQKRIASVLKDKSIWVPAVISLVQEQILRSSLVPRALGGLIDDVTTASVDGVMAQLRRQKDALCASAAKQATEADAAAGETFGTLARALKKPLGIIIDLGDSLDNRESCVVCVCVYVWRGGYRQR